MNELTQSSEIVGGRRSGGDTDDEDWSIVVECAALERTKSERGARGENDRRRRTIIVEKKNGTYGFTLQSYGIHYKREQEIEMVTYVDYVDYDGPAYLSGMREGDVILSINGHEMDRADHKTLVNFIKNCDSRMRMVVSFEDSLQSRLSEFDKLCEREKSIIMGRWKTHSLPARKRVPNCTGDEQTQDQASALTNFKSSTNQCCRPATSTEHLLLYSVYADGRPCLIPQSTACLVAVGPPRSRSDHHHLLNKLSNDLSTSSRHSYHQSNGSVSTPIKTKPNQNKTSSSQINFTTNIETANNIQQVTKNNFCGACISSANRRRGDPNDAGSLDVYDLASPCCDPNCVPSRRRREKQRKARIEQQQQQQQQQQQSHHLQNQKEHGYGSHSCPRASGHSLHSVESSEVSTTIESGVSCSTSLSTDTLYWDPNIQHRPPVCIQYLKPKSWDNLTTKAFGGYGFGYGYLDTASSKTHSAERPNKNNSHSNRSKTPTSNQRNRSTSSGGGSMYSSGQSSSTTTRNFQPTKSTESLLTPYQSDIDTASLSCECLDVNSRFSGININNDKHKNKKQDDNGSNYSTNRLRRSSHGDGKIRSNNTTEITRL
ncbi:hypothetical protein HCN44_007254 [Aphidius gifuensis]|uniref:PDZ domain-containing protein n=1 Tax=Aphidius gifuensis TaxID=684658 RepID=A0A834XP99_APHGI|nr:hypothetical protein HCN44_007254 [Aphidius gifuensis]